MLGAIYVLFILSNNAEDSISISQIRELPKVLQMEEHPNFLNPQAVHAKAYRLSIIHSLLSNIDRPSWPNLST